MTDPPVDELMSVARAIETLDAIPVETRVETVELGNALGRRLAADVACDGDYPPFDKAVMDGFAVVAADDGPRRWVDTVHAGRPADVVVVPGTAVAVMTGAPLPAGADAVIPVEFTETSGESVKLLRPVKPGQAVSRRGADAVANQTMLWAGQVVGPAQVAVAATVGVPRLSVYARPRVAILSTGDELVPIDRTPVGPQIRDSNSAMLVAVLTRLGADVVDVAHCVDRVDELRQALVAGSRYDALFVTGGMSMGQRDYVPGLLAELGYDSKISKLRIKPGKPFVTAVRGRSVIFGLPGNPVSAFICTMRLARRVLDRMAGGPPGPVVRRGTLAHPLPANGPREFYLPATVAGPDVTPLTPTGSADLFTLAKADAILIRPENAAAAAAGDHVDYFAITGYHGEED